MPEQYAVPADFLVGVAEEARRLTNTADQLTTDEMLERLGSVELGGDGGDGEMLEGKARGEVPEYTLACAVLDIAAEPLRGTATEYTT